MWISLRTLVSLLVLGVLGLVTAGGFVLLKSPLDAYGPAARYLRGFDRVRAQAMSPGTATLPGTAIDAPSGKIGAGPTRVVSPDQIDRLVALLETEAVANGPASRGDFDPTLVVRFARENGRLDVMLDEAHGLAALVENGGAPRWVSLAPVAPRASALVAELRP